MATVLVLGASGYVGSYLVPQLAERGHRVRAASRRRDALEARGWDGVEIVEADALDRRSLDRTLDGIEIAYYLVHSMASGGDFAERDRTAAACFRDAAATAGVRRIIYLGGIQPPGKVSPHLASRRETGEILRSGPVPVTEIRAGIVVGPGSAAFEVIRDLVYHLPVMITPRWVRSRSQPIALADLLEYLVRLPEIEETAGRTYDAVGPQVLTYEDLLRQFAAVIGKRLWIIPVPVLSPRLSSYWLDLVTAVPANVARPLVDGLKHDLLSEDSARLREVIPVELHTYEEAVRAALEAEAEAEVPARWAEGAFLFRQERHDIAYYGKSAYSTAFARAGVEEAWAQVASIGGERGWYYANVLWRLRGLLDRLVGGVGMRRGRRHPTELRVGDALDFWRVAAIEPGRTLTLVAEMKLPGSAVLEFSVAPEDGGARIETRAHFHPAGIVGLLYWYGVWPVHKRIFDGMTRAIARRAQRTRMASATGAQTST